MPTQQKSLGEHGEALAAEFLAQRGYRIIARNWRCTGGELDIVAHDGKEWVFVEVRTRRAANIDTAIESVTPRKQARLVLAAQAYLDAQYLGDVPSRIDLVVIALTSQGRQIEVITDAVGW
jgi:putative endonuclease